MNANGTLQTRLTRNIADADVNPSYSPDGTKIAFTSRRDGNSDIYKMTSTGGQQTNLTNNSFDNVDPRWQPLP
jgi:Tol biopolymer transport system component